MASSTNDNSNEQVLTLADVKQLSEDKDKCVMVIDNNVYDITKFLEEHPGGEEVLKEQHGKDATNAFEDVGHSSDAREQMQAYKIGKLYSDAVTKPAKSPTAANPNTNSNSINSDQTDGSWTKWVIPIVIAVAAVVLFKLLVKPNPDINRPPRTI